MRKKVNQKCWNHDHYHHLLDDHPERQEEWKNNLLLRLSPEFSFVTQMRYKKGLHASFYSVHFTSKKSPVALYTLWQEWYKVEKITPTHHITIAYSHSHISQTRPYPSMAGNLATI